MKYIAGIDIGGTTIKLGLFTPYGMLIGTDSVPTDISDKGSGIIRDAAYGLKMLADASLVALEDIGGVGIGVPGPVGADGLVNGCVNLGWGLTDAAGEFSRMSGLPARAVNDANAAALGETWRGSAAGAANAFFVTLGTGVGGAFVSEGKVITGTNGAGGEIGHITVNRAETAYCSCGRRGCLEQYVSATGIIRAVRSALDKGEPSSLSGLDEITGRDVFDAAKNGDAVCLKAVDNACGILGEALAMTACIVDPDIFIIGGGLSGAGDFLIDKVTASYKKAVMYPCADTPIVAASLGNEAGMYGAAAQWL